MKLTLIDTIETWNSLITFKYQHSQSLSVSSTEEPTIAKQAQRRSKSRFRGELSLIKMDWHTNDGETSNGLSVKSTTRQQINIVAPVME